MLLVAVLPPVNLDPLPLAGLLMLVALLPLRRPLGKVSVG